MTEIRGGPGEAVKGKTLKGSKLGSLSPDLFLKASPALWRVISGEQE